MKRALKAHVWDRSGHDWYVEEPWVTSKLLAAERIYGPVLDPACGRGNIVKECRRNGIEAFGMDIVHRGLSGADGWAGEQDFLEETPVRLQFKTIICNPPYGRGKMTEQFIRQAISIAPTVAMLVNGRFLFGSRRAAGLYATHPPSAIYIITPRPSLPPGPIYEDLMARGERPSGGQQDFIWLVWRPDRRGEAETRWLR